MSTDSIENEQGLDEARRYIEHRLFGEDWYATQRRLERHRRLARLSQLIRLRYAEPSLTLTVAARHCGTSKNHLNVLLLREASITFHALLTRYRLLRSVEMLGESDHSVLEVALANGFGSVSSFERNFKKLFGWPPSGLRQALIRPARRRRTTAARRAFTPLPTPTESPIAALRHPP